MFRWEQQWSQHINLYDNCKVLNKISPVHLSSGSASSSQFLPSGADSAPEHQDVISILPLPVSYLTFGTDYGSFFTTFPSWLLFLWQGASFPWLWIKALYASQLAQRWDSFICWLLSAGWVTSGKIAAFVCVSVCARACVLWRCVTLAVHWDVFVSPGLLPAVSPYLWVTSTPDSFPDTGGITHDIKTPNPDATEPVESEPRAVTVSNVCSRLTELTCLSTHIDYFQLL